MQVTETLSDGLKRSYAVVLPASDIGGKRDTKLKDLSRTLRLPGFRPGKVPASLVRQRFGTAVMAEVLEESVQSAMDKVLSDRGLRAASQPRVDVKQADPDRDIEFDVEVELLPEITMPDFAAMELVRLKVDVPADAVDRALENIARRQRELVDVTEDRGARQGDVLVVDYDGKVDGVAFPGGAGQDASVEIGGQGFIPGFSEGMLDMKPGEERTIDVTFPAEYHATELAGKAATFDIKAKTLKEGHMPEMDDAFAEKIGFENMADLRDAVSRTHQNEYDGVARMRLKRQLLDKLAAAVDFPVPSSMVDAEFDQIWQRVEADRKEGKGDAEDQGKDEDTLRGEYRAIAERRVRLGLLLSEIGRVNNVSVSPDEMTRAMRNEAGRYPGQEVQVMEFFRKNPRATDALRGPLFEDKVVDFVLELARVEDRTVTPEELSAEPDAAPAESAAA